MSEKSPQNRKKVEKQKSSGARERRRQTRQKDVIRKIRRKAARIPKAHFI